MKYYTLLLLPLISFFQELQANTVATDNPIDIQHYVFHLSISDETDLIKGKTEITLKLLGENVTKIALDLVSQSPNSDQRGMKVTSVRKDNRSLHFEQKDEKLLIDLNEQLPANQIINIEVVYQGIPEDGLVISENKFGDRTFFGDNWPNRAHHWLPTVDHPSDKASCEFIITSPVHYQVVANGMLREESNVTMGSYQNQMKITHWVNREPIPTKVMVFGAARFAVLHADMVDRIPVEYWVYPEDKEGGYQQMEPSSGILKLFEQMIGPYPYHKLANVESKTNYGGMENASNIFYNESAINNNSSIEALISHEVAHQWFGDAVTETDWPHVWLSEGFATYFTHLYFESTYGRDSMNSRLQADKSSIFAFFNKSPEIPVIDTLSTSLTTLLNANSYQKGGWFLHMLRYQVGDEAFFQGIKDYYQLYRHRNASTSDFRLVLEKASGQSLKPFFDQWLRKPGHPYLKGSYKYRGIGKKLIVDLTQAQENNMIYDLNLQIGVVYKGESELQILEMTLDKKENEASFKLKKAPKEIILDPNSWILMDYVFEEK